MNTMREIDLVPSIEALFRSVDSYPITEYPVWIQGSWKRVEVVSARWLNNTRLETIAVECKLGNDWDAIGRGLNQALAYQTMFPKVYIATEASVGDLGHLKKILSSLGIGYIQIFGKSAHIELETGKNILSDWALFQLQVVNQLGRFAVCSEHMGESYTRQGAGEGGTRFWMSGKEKKKSEGQWKYLTPKPVPAVLTIGLQYIETQSQGALMFLMLRSGLSFGVRNLQILPEPYGIVCTGAMLAFVPFFLYSARNLCRCLTGVMFRNQIPYMAKGSSRVRRDSSRAGRRGG